MQDSCLMWSQHAHPMHAACVRCSDPVSDKCETLALGCEDPTRPENKKYQQDHVYFWQPHPPPLPKVKFDVAPNSTFARTFNFWFVLWFFCWLLCLGRISKRIQTSCHLRYFLLVFCWVCSITSMQSLNFLRYSNVTIAMQQRPFVVEPATCLPFFRGSKSIFFCFCSSQKKAPTTWVWSPSQKQFFHCSIFRRLFISCASWAFRVAVNQTRNSPGMKPVHLPTFRLSFLICNSCVVLMIDQPGECCLQKIQLAVLGKCNDDFYFRRKLLRMMLVFNRKTFSPCRSYVDC